MRAILLFLLWRVEGSRGIAELNGAKRRPIGREARPPGVPRPGGQGCPAVPSAALGCMEGPSGAASQCPGPYPRPDLK